jgi:hypothetical protein
MSNCQYCSRTLSNNKAVAYRCSNCNTVWCANGTCTGSSGRVQNSRTAAALCQTCQKAGCIVKV